MEKFAKVFDSHDRQILVKKGADIVANLISVEPDYEFIDPNEEQVFASGAWIAEHCDGKGGLLQHVDINPLRAAMTVFLMMQESANVQDNPAR